MAYRWPLTLIVPPRPPSVVYLDLNHWISLAKAMSGHPDGAKHKDALAACMAARESGAAVFPISDAIIIETCKISQHRQRRDLRTAIEELSQYRVVTSRPVIANHEIEAMLDDVVGPSPEPINSMHYLDWGIARAFGKVGGFRVRDAQGIDITDDIRAAFPDGPEAFDAKLFDAELDLQRHVLDGPTPDEVPRLRELGWDPSGTIEISGRRAQQEIEQVDRFNADPHWRRGRIRDVVSARELWIEINEMLYRGIDARGVTLDDVLGPPERTRQHVDAMPSFDVAVTLKTVYQRDPEHRWTANDIHDIDALSSTLPYCDIVVTDKAVAAQANSSGLAERLETRVLARLSDLGAHL